jgi:hypothetical protein
MRCEDLDLLIDEAAEGPPGTEPEALAWHLGECRACRERLRLARAIAHALELRPVPQPPPRFTAQVMSKIGRERWRTEQLVDAGFNVAVAAGVALVAAGVVGLTWWSGWFSIDRAALDVAAPIVARWLSNALDQAPMVAMAAMLLTSALALWWWVEGGVME